MNKTALLSLMLTFSATSTLAINTGPEVGEKVPAFEVRDQTGQTRTFENLKGPNGLLLLFHRTADW